ncbi:hypothetical protein EVA_18301 [gut metagenome]|uniref:Uncharacterized protein n=1 Tax=gut metagenome TaxID=749906 RepID=J9FGP5_9ZZZZ
MRKTSIIRSITKGITGTMMTMMTMTTMMMTMMINELLLTVLALFLFV